MQQYRLISFIGYSETGKTASIEAIVKYLTKEGRFCIAIKHIHQIDFTLDTPGKNTWRFARAGARIVGSLSDQETAFICNWQSPIEDMVEMALFLAEKQNPRICETPIVILTEGFRNVNAIQILCASTLIEIEKQWNAELKAIGGKISKNSEQSAVVEAKYHIPVLNFLESPSTICRFL